jgi:hypothetical protein
MKPMCHLLVEEHGANHSTETAELDRGAFDSAKRQRLDRIL